MTNLKLGWRDLILIKLKAGRDGNAQRCSSWLKKEGVPKVTEVSGWREINFDKIKTGDDDAHQDERFS